LGRVGRLAVVEEVTSSPTRQRSFAVERYGLPGSQPIPPERALDP
jgi:hypothetical protein